MFQASAISYKQSRLEETHSSTSSGPLVEDRGLVARHRVSRCHVPGVGSAMCLHCSFMVQADVTCATSVSYV
jgi:hypothetical protein